MSFRLKVILGLSAVVATLLVGSFWIGYRLHVNSAFTELGQQSRVDAALLVAAVTKEVRLGDRAGVESRLQAFVANPDVDYARVYDARGEVLASAGTLPTSPDSDSVTGAAAVHVGGVLIGRVEVGLSAAPVRRQLQHMSTNISLLGVFALLLSVVLGGALGAFLSRDLRRLREASRQLERGELGYQLTISGNDELAETMTAFNHMSRSLLQARTAASEREQAMRESEKQLAEAQRVARLGNWSWELGTDHIRWSEQVFQLFGLPCGDFPRSYEDYLSLIHPEDRDRVQRSVQAAMQGERPFDISYRIIRRADGVVRYLHDQGEVVRDEQGEAIRIVGIVRDIDEAKRAEEELLNQRNWLETLINAMPDLVCFKDGDGHWLVANDYSLELLGISGIDYRGKSDAALAEYATGGGEILQQQQAADELAWQRQQLTYAEATMPAGDGAQRDFDMIRVPLFNLDGSRKGLVVVGRDVTARRRAELALRESEARNRTVVESIFDGLVTLDSAGVILSVNRAAERMFAGDSRQFVGQPFGALLSEDDRQVIEPSLHHHLSGRGNDLLGTVREVVGVRRDGSYFPLELTMGEAAQESRHLIIAVVRDITERKQEEQIRLRREARSRRQQETLLGIAHRQAALADDLPQMLREIAEQASATLEVEHVGIWMFDEGHLALSSVDLYQHSRDAHHSGADIRRDDVPAYFTALEEDRLIAADDVATDPRTREYSAAYLAAYGIASLLAAPIRLGGRLVGLISHEHVGTVRHWALDERNFAASVADAISLSMELYERRQAERDLHLSARVFENSSEGILITDADNNILRVNRAFVEITGYNQEEILGCSPNVLKSGRHDEPFYQEMWARLQEEGSWQGEIWNRRKNGELYPEWLSINELRNEHGEITHYIAVFTDISERKAAEEQIHHLAYYDALTDLPNRTLLQGRLQQAMAEVERDGGQVALLYIDLDRFKTINDTLGHTSGDILLKSAADRLRRGLRGSDTVARLGGDEFVVMLSGVHHTQEAAHTAQKILSLMDAPFLLDGHEVFITTSVGIAMYPDDAASLDDLVKYADTAMYHAKEEGRNNFQFYRAEMNASAFERLVMENSLRRALERGEFLLYYQPQVDLRSGEVVGAEALIRWRHPELGLVAPGQFIPVLEETGMILEVGQWVLEQACAQQVAWQAAGLPPLRVAVNLSPIQFMQKGLTEMLTDVLARTGIDPSALELEITESSLMKNAERSISTLREWKAMGVRLSIDDFGTGYSSLSYLKQFPIDTLKIDQSFVRDVCIDADDAAIASTVIAMGHSLNLRVLAEGVETAEQLAFLSGEGCDEMQGYLFSRPLPLEELEQLLGSGRRLDQRPAGA